MENTKHHGYIATTDGTDFNDIQVLPEKLLALLAHHGAHYHLQCPIRYWGEFLRQFFGPENLWHFDTARGMSVGKYPESTGVGSGMIFRFHVFSLGFLWLTMCPLIFAMVERRRDVEVAARGAWRRARSQAGPILAASFLFYLLGIGAFLSFSLLASGIVPDVPLPFGSSLYLGLFLIIGGIIYLGVNWSLYNQIIIIEDQRLTITSLRRSSELVRGMWGRAFGMYLLLVLVTMMLTSTVLGLTLLLFSLTVPEFAPLREVLLSVKFLTLFVGGYARDKFRECTEFLDSWGNGSGKYTHPCVPSTGVGDSDDTPLYGAGSDQ